MKTTHSCSAFLHYLSAFFKDLWLFAKTRKVWWMLPVVVLLLLVAVLLISVSTISPFIYTLF
ncbi:MAG: hypothetical protein JW739_06980 [Opitutales bacterium]|nr:hypothetical protein [Opitutales bacterium]